MIAIEGPNGPLPPEPDRKEDPELETGRDPESPALLRETPLGERKDVPDLSPVLVAVAVPHSISYYGFPTVVEAQRFRDRLRKSTHMKRVPWKSMMYIQCSPI